jgi:hypothetical protein
MKPIASLFLLAIVSFCWTFSTASAQTSDGKDFGVERLRNNNSVSFRSSVGRSGELFRPVSS